MTKRIKPIPRNQSEVIQDQIIPYLNEGKAISDTVFSENRGTDYSFKGDTVKDISIGLEDIDNAVLYYFNNIIKPTVIQNNNRIAVPVIYGSSERWKSVQNDGFYRDKDGKLMVPIIMFKRDSIEKNRTLGNKIDGNKSQLYQVVGTKFNKRNVYDKFDVLNNRIPSQQYYVSVVPDYINITYSCIIFTDFVEQNNKLVEAIEFASDSYWGDPNRFKFRANIDNFTTTTILEQGADRAAKSSFNIKMFGYIIPNTVNKDMAVASSKFYTKAQVIFELETVDGGGDRLSVGKKPIINTVGSTSFVGGGNNITNINIINNQISEADTLYLNTNINKLANIVTENSAIFTGALILEPIEGSSIPPTSISNFSVFINGQYIPPNIITLENNLDNVTLLFNTSSLGYTLDSDFEITAIGKFQ
jgi:hypothetical protein